MAIRRKTPQKYYTTQGENPYIIGDCQREDALELIRARKEGITFQADPTLEKWVGAMLYKLVNFLIEVRKQNTLMLGECPAHPITYRGVVFTTTGEVMVIDLKRVYEWLKEANTILNGEVEIIKE